MSVVCCGEAAAPGPCYAEGVSQALGEAECGVPDFHVRGQWVVQHPPGTGRHVQAVGQLPATDAPGNEAGTNR